MSPFLFLAVDLPPPPLFQDTVEKNIIPQVSIHSVLAKYDGITTQVGLTRAFRTFSLKINYQCNCAFFCRNLLVSYAGISVNTSHDTSFYTTGDSQRTPSSRRKTQQLSHSHSEELISVNVSSSWPYSRYGVNTDTTCMC